MSNTPIRDLSDTRELDADAMRGIRGGLFDYSNRLGYVGQEIEDSRNPPPLWDNGPSIDDAATAGDDSMYYPGLTPIRS